MPSEWRDITSYSRGQQDRTPRTWEIRVGAERICVTRHMYFPPDVWVLRCNISSLDERDLESRDLEEAKQEALLRVRKYYTETAAAFDEVCHAE